MRKAPSRTVHQQRGAWAEELAANQLLEQGWCLLARNLRLGRDEIDLLALDPGPPASLVVVEVRGLHVSRFGAPEERVDAAKVARLYRAAAGLRREGLLPGGEALPRLPVRVDLLVVDARQGSDHPELRHLRSIEPP